MGFPCVAMPVRAVTTCAWRELISKASSGNFAGYGRKKDEMKILLLISLVATLSGTGCTSAGIFGAEEYYIGMMKRSGHKVEFACVLFDGKPVSFPTELAKKAY